MIRDASWSRAPNVVVVDDDPLIGPIVSATLAGAGFRTTSVAGVADCLWLIDSTPDAHLPVALLVDIFMPEADIFDLMRELARRKCRVPLIVMTGVDNEYLIVAAEFGRVWGLTVVGTMTKPLAHDRLLAHLDKLRPSLPGRLQGRAPMILVADDDLDIRALVAEIFRAEGFDVLEAADGQEAFEKLRMAEHVDVLLTDIDMPRMNGVGLAFSAERLRPKTKIIFTSGKIDMPPMANTLFVPKPFRIPEMIALVRRTLPN